MSLFAALLLSGEVYAAGLVEGLRKYEAGDYAGAVAEWQPLADRGNPDALFNLGQVYRLGRGFQADLVRAADYYRRAADLDHAGARGALATIYYFDHGTRAKRGEAIALWRLAAAVGDAPSQYTLAILHFNGQDVPKDLMQAYAWALLAAEGGLAEGIKAEQSIRSHLSPNQLQQARVLKGGLVVSTLDLVPIVGPITGDDGGGVVKTQEVATAASLPAPAPASLPGPGPGPEATEKAEAAPVAAVPEAMPREVPPAEALPANAWSVQLGFYRSRLNAENYWRIIASEAEELIPGIESRLVTVDTGTERGIFYRLLAGSFGDRAGADYLCDNLKASGVDCVVKRP